MRVVMSNLAWDAAADEAMASVLLDAGVRGVELAPTKVFTAPLEASPEAVAACRRSWEQRGLAITSLQSLLFGRPDLQLFDPSTRQAFVDHLCGMARLGGALGAGPLVFGSPKNRRRGDLSPDDARDIAAGAFGAVARVAHAEGTCLCIEPNPVDYGADFVTTADEGAELVRLVDHPGFRLHLDLGGMVLAGDDPALVISRHADVLAHFHCSEPGLAPIGTTLGVPHEVAAEALRASGYRGVVSIEMLVTDGDVLTVARSAARVAVRCYG